MKVKIMQQNEIQNLQAVYSKTIKTRNTYKFQCIFHGKNKLEDIIEYEYQIIFFSKRIRTYSLKQTCW